MKKIFATSLLLLSAAAFVACSNDDDDTPGPSVKYDVISFEPSTGMVDPSGETIALGNVTMSLYMNGAYVDHTYSNVFCGKPYAQGHNFDDMLFSTADGMASFLSYYSGDYDAWGGIALAACPDKGSDAASLTQQFSVWANGGANGTSTYAVCYDSNTPTEAYPEYMTASGYPTILFAEPRTVDHFYIANSTYVYKWFSGAETDHFEVKITGFKNDVEVGSTTETLVTPDSKLDGWRKVSLASFGEVDKLVFKVQGINVYADPSYFCIDEITLVKK